jgi:hypothetical protein
VGSVREVMTRPPQLHEEGLIETDRDEIVLLIVAGEEAGRAERRNPDRATKGRGGSEGIVAPRPGAASTSRRPPAAIARSCDPEADARLDRRRRREAGAVVSHPIGRRPLNQASWAVVAPSAAYPRSLWTCGAVIDRQRRLGRDLRVGSRRCPVGLEPAEQAAERRLQPVALEVRRLRRKRSSISDALAHRSSTSKIAARASGSSSARRS